MAVPRRTWDLHKQVIDAIRKRKGAAPTLSAEQARIRQARHDYEDRELERRQREADRIA